MSRQAAGNTTRLRIWTFALPPETDTRIPSVSSDPRPSSASTSPATPSNVRFSQLQQLTTSLLVDRGAQARAPGQTDNAEPLGWRKATYCPSRIRRSQILVAFRPWTETRTGHPVYMSDDGILVLGRRSYVVWLEILFPAVYSGPGCCRHRGQWKPWEGAWVCSNLRDVQDPRAHANRLGFARRERTRLRRQESSTYNHRLPLDSRTRDVQLFKIAAATSQPPRSHLAATSQPPRSHQPRLTW